jgi:hypothetical protein
MKNLSMQSRKPWLSFQALPANEKTAAFLVGVQHALHRLNVRYARPFLVAACLGNIPAHYAVAGCGCNDQEQAPCTTCEPCAETPRLCGLGNGLLDYLDKASGRFESHLFSLRRSGRTCDSQCSPSCDVLAGGGSSAMMTDSGYETSGLSDQHYASPSQPSSESWHSSQSDSSETFNESPVPVPVPDPVASPPMSSPTPMPVPKRAGNPFTDEVRSFRTQDNLESSGKVVYSIRPSSITELVTAKGDFVRGDFAKVEVKPVPKHLLRGRSAEKVLDSQGLEGQMQAIQSEVIPATSVSPPVSSRVQFAR